MNDPIGYYGLGQCYATGFGVKQDAVKSRAYLEKAAEGGHALAMTKLGDYHRLNAKNNVDFETAKQYYTDAAKQNEPEAIINLGLLHYRNQIANASVNLAFQYFDSAAKKGAPGAWYWLGVLYQKGDGVQQNADQARKYYLKAIDSGHLGAKFKLATMFEEEANKPKLKPKAKTALYEQSHRLFLEYVLDPTHNPANNLISMRRLGMYFDLGLSGMKNPRAARYWYETAASENDSEAMLWMYRCLRESEPDAALRWLDSACRDEHNAEAHYVKGILHLEGFPPLVKIDLKAARLEFEIAARDNHPGAIAKLLVL
ncbi:MAG: sel1 repeat family protein [Bacillus subtilis]|nr:sel1 repeat family protein [Bacillus subtilis]